MDTIRQNIASGLRRARKAAGLSVNEVGASIGKSGKTISAWEVGRGQPDGDELINLCRILGVPLSDFYGVDAVIPSADAEYRDIPLFGTIAAGTPIEMEAADSTHPIPVELHKRYPDAFLLKVRGDSMNRVLPNGCYALVNPCKEVAVDNKPYAVCVNGYNATIKRVRKLNNGFELVPDSNDPTYKPTVFDYGEPGTETITVIGRVVWYCVPFDFEL